jgi:hypothetical protein
MTPFAAKHPMAKTPRFALRVGAFWLDALPAGEVASFHPETDLFPFGCVSLHNYSSTY